MYINLYTCQKLLRVLRHGSFATKCQISKYLEGLEISSCAPCFTSIPGPLSLILTHGHMSPRFLVYFPMVGLNSFDWLVNCNQRPQNSQLTKYQKGDCHLTSIKDQRTTQLYE